MTDSYAQDLLALIRAFEYETCEECGGDLDQHVFSPDPLGKPHAWCINTAESIVPSLDKVTRLEVIDATFGRALVRYGVQVRLELQDEGRTLKVFVQGDARVSNHNPPPAVDIVITHHKADGIDAMGGSVCKHCGEAVHRVPGGHGPVWVHTDTGMIIGVGAER